MKGNKVNSATPSLWLAQNPSKRWGEVFFLLYTPFWLTLCLGIVVPFKLYEDFTEWEYLLVGLISALPALIVPMIFVGKWLIQMSRKEGEPWRDCKVAAMLSEVTGSSCGNSFLQKCRADRNLAWKDRYWVKANLWIAIFTYVGNYFWTHYFFTVLGASYTFPSWKMNNVPHTTFLLAHVCFLFYHVSANMTLRRLQHAIADLPENVQWAFRAGWILAYAYFIAYLETLAISNFPYYDFVDRAVMYKVGSLFYAIYFIVSYPMFFRVDEKPGDSWDLPRVSIDALGAAMLVTILLDLWRICLGSIVPVPETKQCPQSGLPWFAVTS